MAYTILSDDYRFEIRPIPDIGDDEVLVKVLAVGICAGDAKCFSGVPYFWGKFNYYFISLFHLTKIIKL